jgi:VanZ family protein
MMRFHIPPGGTMPGAGDAVQSRLMKSFDWLRAWVPALLVMLVIFIFSSRPSDALPHIQGIDLLVKKGGHVIGYGMLALAYWTGFGKQPGRQGAAWLLALAYAVTDEFHQSFVPGRGPSALDVLVFDNLGAVGALVISTYYSRKGRRHEAAGLQAEEP